MKFFGVRKIVIVTGGVFLFAFLSIKAQVIDFKQNERYVSQLRQLNEIDAQLNQEILEAKDGGLDSYDPIAKELEAIYKLQTILQQPPSFISRQSKNEINNLLEAYIKLFQQKQRLIEEFKFRNAILKNSLSDFPIAMSDLSVKVYANYGDDEWIAELNLLLRKVLNYNLSNSEDLAIEIVEQLEKVRQIQTQIDPSFDMDKALGHAEIILQNKPQVNSLVEEILAMPTVPSSDKLTRSYNLHYRQALKQAEVYRNLWYGFSIILLLSLVAYIIFKLRKSAISVRQAEEKYRSIFETSVEGIFQTTLDGRYLRVNSTLAQIYGYSSPEELCASITDIGRQLYVQPGRRAEFIRSIQKQGSISGFESQVYRKDGNVIWIVEKARAICNRDGDLLYYEGTVEDITVRKAWQEALGYEQEQSKRLLLNILPEPIAEQLKQTESTIADSFEEVTVLFADIVGFTELASICSPTQLVELLNQIFSAFDEVSECYGLEKIKTIGDAYMVVGGLPRPRPDHAEAIAQMALDMQKIINHFNQQNHQALSIRIGINTGPVVAGVIGIKKFSYDLWGDTVNTASRMESQGIANQVQVTEATYQRLKDKFIFEERGLITVKGKGEMMTYFLIGKKADKDWVVISE
ncbi:MAG TPA: diguanylate cyclase [Cyanobacteria bacterium UBA8803]|nr:diguanylate cyclase [Cyanobacteria bacterium UBA9273]HBL62858.1 diguanylate cyclase [Cyanobacteria bacterium UBA8803]